MSNDKAPFAEEKTHMVGGAMTSVNIATEQKRNENAHVDTAQQY